MYPLKADTAITIPFFAHDVNGDAVTGLVDGDFTKRISKNGGAFGVMTVTITEMEDGWYSLPVDAGHSDTLGVLSITFTSATIKQVNLQFRIHANLPDDLPRKTEMDAAHALLVTLAALTTHDNKLAPVALDGGPATIGGMLTKMADNNDGADFDAGTDSLEVIGDKVTTLGAGATTWTYTLTDSAPPNDPIADADVWVTSDIGGTVVIASGTTDANGVVTFYLDYGSTIYIWAQKTGWNFDNPDTEVVS